MNERLPKSLFPPPQIGSRGLPGSENKESKNVSLPSPTFYDFSRTFPGTSEFPDLVDTLSLL